MNKKKRIWYPGATYHVMSRGNRRTALFKEQDDYLVFLTYLKRAQELYGFTIHRMFVEGKISHAEQEMLIQKDIKEDDMWLPW